MNNATSNQKFSYVSWILGQTSAILGVVLCMLWGFDLVILQAQYLYAQAHAEAGTLDDSWYPTFGPALVGLVIALAGWLVSHVQHCKIPTPVIVGAAVNLLALLLAFFASSF